MTGHGNSRRAGCGGLLACLALPAWSQHDGEVREVDRVEVTGSLNKRSDAVTALPLQIITRESVERIGALTASDVLTQLPSNVVGRIDAPYNSSVGYTQ